MARSARSPRTASGEPCCECGEKVPAHSRHCLVCGADNGCPNVRAAGSLMETAALGSRLSDAEISAEARGCRDLLERFGSAVTADSKAVIARDLTWLDNLTQSDSNVHASWAKQVFAGMRAPEDNDWDLNRTSVESAILPNYHSEISFCALSLDGLGMRAFGSFSITIKTSAIAARSSVFEENPFTFCRRHSVVAGDSPPPGYRADWQRRGDLARAKLHSRLEPNMTEADFASVLVSQGTGTGDGDFVEVHVFGGIHRRAIERVIAPQDLKRHDRALWRSVKRRLLELGVEVEER
jgi:hypothetical protein